MANLDESMKDLNLVVERCPSDRIAYVDRECVNALKSAIGNSSTQSNQSPLLKNSVDEEAYKKAVQTFT